MIFRYSVCWGKSEIEIKSIFFMDFELGLEEIYEVMGWGYWGEMGCIGNVVRFCEVGRWVGLFKIIGGGESFGM